VGAVGAVAAGAAAAIVSIVDVGSIDYSGEKVLNFDAVSLIVVSSRHAMANDSCVAEVGSELVVICEIAVMTGAGLSPPVLLGPLKEIERWHWGS
jgi:hypothetical protein